jgi:hypothetical protein
VRVHHEADRAQQHQHRRGGAAAPFALRGPAARRRVEAPEGGEDEERGGEPRGGMELEQRAQRAAEGEGDPVEERRVVHPQQARDARHQQVAALGHGVHDAQAQRIVRLPEIVPDAGQNEQDRDQRERRRGQRQRQGRQPGRHAPKTTSPSWCSGA